MSTPNDNDQDAIKPPPRRTFDLSTPSTIPSTPASEQQGFPQQNGRPSVDGASTPARTRSILNLTSSTLFGIYRDTDYTTERDGASTPWGTGAETPAEGRKGSIELLRNSIPDAFAKSAESEAKPKRKDLATTRRRSHHVRKGLRGYWLPLVSTIIALFSVGVLYGLMVRHLHARDDIAPVKVEGIDHNAWEYLVFWGFAGIILGYALPAVDAFWSESQDEVAKPRDTQQQARGSGAWSDVLRSITAFVGVAFAIRKLPWQSTSQLSLTLALANPAVWYLIDRSAPGFIVSTAVAIAGTAITLGINPGLVPTPNLATHLPTHIVKRMGHNITTPALDHDQLVLGIFSEESVGVAAWIASVLFVSAVCFGNIGRRLVGSQR